MKKTATPRAINEFSRFEIPGETFGWTGEGQIHIDNYDKQSRWFSTSVNRDWGKALTGAADVEVVIRLRGEQAGETLVAIHPEGTGRLNDISVEKPSLYRFYIRSTATGEVWVSFKFDSNRKMVIESISVLGPVRKKTTKAPIHP